MRVTLLGGTGFIGRHVTRWLLATGADVTVIHRGRTAACVPGVRTRQADRHDSPVLTRELAAATPAVLIDMIAYTQGDMERLLEALPACLERLIVISSGDVYWTYEAFLGLDPASPPAGPLDEQARLRERLHPYRARAAGPEDLLHQYEKILVERTAQRGARVPVTVLRLPMVYGPGDPQNRIGGYLSRLKAGSGLLRLNPVEAAWRCTRGYVEDVAWAIQLAALDSRAAGRVYNAGEEDAPTEIEWLRAVAAAAGWTGQVTSDQAAAPSMPARWEIPLVVDTSRIREELGYREPTGRREGLLRTISS